MTVVTTLLTKDYIAVGSDSLITSWKDGNLEVMEKKQPKFIPFPKLRCVACYWGLAQVYDTNGKLIWSMNNWLKSQLKYSEDCKTIEQFGNQLTKSLNNILTTGIAKNVTKKGIGIHLAGFENFDNEIIPELFLISNYSLNNGFYSVNDRIDFSRRTYLDYKGETNFSTIQEQRKYFKQVLDKMGLLVYNNGDPILFNTFANSFYFLLAHSKNNGKLKDITLIKEKLKIKELKELASYPIKLVKEFQDKFYKENCIVVGGKVLSKTIDTKGQWK